MFDSKKTNSVTMAVARASLKEKMLKAGSCAGIEVTLAEFIYTLLPEFDILTQEVRAERATQLRKELASQQHKQFSSADSGAAVAGVNVQQYDSELSRIAGLTATREPDHKEHLDKQCETQKLDRKPNKVMEEVTPENIRIGDFITVKEWTSHVDNSYKGDLLEVKKIALPHVFVQRHGRNSYLNDKIQLSFDRVVLLRASQDFIDGHRWLTDKKFS